MKFIHGTPLQSIGNSKEGNLTSLQKHLLTTIPEEKQENFFTYNLKDLNSPFLLPDISSSIVLIRSMIKKGKHFLLYGDRDTDGVSSTSLLSIYLRNEIEKFKGKITVRTSSENDDYGICPSVLQNIKSIKPDILITLDFGTSNFQEINELASLGMKIIVLDHHEIPVQMPDCLLINPKREDSNYPEKKICTSFIALKLIQALIISEIYETKEKKGGETLFSGLEPSEYDKLDYKYYMEKYPEVLEKTKEYCDLSSIGTITDMMPLLGENRILVRNGMFTLENNLKVDNPDKKGLTNLLKNLGLNPNKINSKDLGWGIGPVLNAAGRMGKTEVALNLLLTTDSALAESKARELVKINKERRERTKRNLYKVTEYFERKPERKQRKIIFCYEPDLEPGVSGIVASRLVEEYKRPVVFVTPDHGKARGSVRTYGSENVIDLLDMLAELLDHYGGHPEAGGFSIGIEKMKELENKLIEVADDWLTEKTKVETTKSSIVSLTPEELTENIFQEISAFEPFGQGNPSPLLSIKGAEIIAFKTMGDGSHGRFSILKSDSRIKGVVWNTAKDFYNLSSLKGKIDIWGELEENYFNGTTTIQFVVSHFE